MNMKRNFFWVTTQVSDRKLGNLNKQENAKKLLHILEVLNPKKS